MAPVTQAITLLCVATILAVAATTADAKDLFPVFGLHVRSWADQADGAAFPSQNAAFATRGVTPAFDSFYLAHTTGAGLNTIAVEVPLGDDANANANRLANLLTWAAGVGGSAPHVLLTLGGADRAGPSGPAAAQAHALVSALAGSLKAADGSPSLAYRRIVAYRIGPAVNVLAAANGSSSADAATQIGAVSAQIRDAERSAFGAAAQLTPVEADYSFDYALLTQGKTPGSAIAPADLSVAYGDLKSYFDPISAAHAADILGLDWFPGSLSAGSDVDLVSTIGRMAQDYPSLAVIIGQTGDSTAVNTEPDQAAYALRVLAGLTAGSGLSGRLLGVCFAYDKDAAAPAPPDSGTADRVGQWPAADAGHNLAAAYRGATDANPDAVWWLQSVNAGMGLTQTLADGTMGDKQIVGGFRQAASLGTAPQQPSAGQPATASVVPAGQQAAAPGGGGAAPAATGADLSVASLAIAQGTLAPGQQVVLHAVVANSFPQLIPGAAVQFVYAIEGNQDWQVINAQPLTTDIPAGGQVDVAGPAWTVPAKVTQVGVLVQKDGLTEVNQDNNSLIADPAALAASGVIMAQQAAAGATSPNGQPAGNGGAAAAGSSVLGGVGSMLQQKAGQLASSLMDLAASFLTNKLGGAGGLGGGGFGGGVGGGVGVGDGGAGPPTGVPGDAGAAQPLGGNAGDNGAAGAQVGTSGAAQTEAGGAGAAATATPTDSGTGTGAPAATTPPDNGAGGSLGSGAPGLGGASILPGGTPLGTPGTRNRIIFLPPAALLGGSATHILLPPHAGGTGLATPSGGAGFGSALGKLGTPGSSAATGARRSITLPGVGGLTTTPHSSSSQAPAGTSKVKTPFTNKLRAPRLLVPAP